MRNGGRSSRYTAWPVTWARADSWGIDSATARLVRWDAEHGRRSAPAWPFARGSRSGRFVIELDRMFSASCRRKSRDPRTSEIGSTSARATAPASRNVASENGRPARNASVAGSLQHGRPDAAVGDRGRLDPFAVSLDPDAGAKGRDVHLLALGDLVELHDLVVRGGSGISTRVMISSGATTVCFGPRMEVRRSPRAGSRACRPIRARPRRSAGSRASRRPASRGRCCRPAWRHCGSAASRTARVSAWISGELPLARTPRAAPRSRWRRPRARRRSC